MEGLLFFFISPRQHTSPGTDAKMETRVTQIYLKFHLFIVYYCINPLKYSIHIRMPHQAGVCPQRSGLDLFLVEVTCLAIA